jgi:RES domain-containing protein
MSFWLRWSPVAGRARPMLSLPALASAVASARPMAASLAALAIRAVHLRHFSNFAIVNPLHAATGGAAGSRFVVPGGPASLYLALDSEPAYREGNQVFFQTAGSLTGAALIQSGALRPAPTVLFGAFVRTTRLLDLRDALTRNQLGILNVNELLGPWKGSTGAATQLLGNTVFNDGQFEGTLYPSAQHLGHDCLVLFPDRLLHTSLVDFADASTGLAAKLP